MPKPSTFLNAWQYHLWLSFCLCLWNVRLSLPQTVGGVFIERLADYLLVKSVFGFSLAWDGGSGVYLKMSEAHQGTPCGLCGNFNHIAGDDLATARGRTGQTGPSSVFLLTQHPLSAITVIIHSAPILVNYRRGGTIIYQSRKKRTVTLVLKA